MTKEELGRIADEFPVVATDATSFTIFVPATGRYWRIETGTNGCSEAEVREILRGEREPNMLYLINRIVGYYSRTENWNASKLAELSDRRRGGYNIETGLKHEPSPRIPACGEYCRATHDTADRETETVKEKT